MIFRLLPLSLLLPILVSADGVTNLKGLITSVNEGIVGSLGTLFLAASVVAFFFGVARFILAQQSGVEKDIANGKQLMLWGVIALFVAFSIYGIIKFGQNQLNITNTSTIVLPTFQIDSGGTKTNPTPSVTPGTPTPTTPTVTTDPCDKACAFSDCSSGTVSCATADGATGMCTPKTGGFFCSTRSGR